MNRRVLEVNVDDTGMGGVYSLVRSVILHKPDHLQIDLAAVVPFERKEDEEELAALGTRVFYVGTQGSILRRPFVYYRKTRRLLEQRHYDCVHIHGDTAYMLLVFAAAARDAGAKSIILHSHAAGIDRGPRRLKLALHRLARPLLRSCASCFAACSDYAAAWMYPNIPADRVQMIPNGINLSLFSFDAGRRAQVREQLGLADAFVVGHVGRFSYQKNHTFLLEAFARIHKRIPQAVLLLVGEGELMEQTRLLARRLGIEKEVIFYGISRDVASLMQAMDLFLLPSRFEGLPVAGVEAQSAGLPVIFSTHISRQSKITDPVIFLPADQEHIDRWVHNALVVYKNPRLYGPAARIPAAGQVEKAGFSIDDTVKSFLRLYGRDR